MRAWTSGLAVILALALASTAAGQRTAVGQRTAARPRIDPARYLAHVRTLAADELGGRGNGTPGLQQAADYIAGEFKQARLEGGGDQRGFLQAFDVPFELEDGAGAFAIRTGDGSITFRLGQHYYPLSEPAGGETPAASGDSALAFAGYGISAPGLGYDDYAGLDVGGKAVVVFTHEPQEDDAGSVFAGRALTPFSDLHEKAATAARRGARFLIVVEDPVHVVDRALTREWTRDPQIDRFELPVIRVDRTRLDRVLTEVDFEAVARRIDRTLAPESRVLGAASITFIDPLTRVSTRVSNVVGVLRGRDPAVAGEAVVIGAHYDHLGRGGLFSADPRGAGQIHNGADDNASGTAAVIEIATALARAARPRRSIVFVAFAGEEIGLLGSRHYVGQPPRGIRRTIAMINLDMIGRAAGRVMIGGGERPPFRAALRAARAATRLRLDDFSAGGYDDGDSDSASFARQRVPTLALFTGFHADYHRPSDDWERIDAGGAAQIAQLALAVAVQVANR